MRAFWGMMFWMARENVRLYRKVLELEARDRLRLSRIAGLKLRLTVLEGRPQEGP